MLFAALGRPHCPTCGEPIAAQSAEQIAERLLRDAPGTPIAVLAPVVRGRKGAFKKELRGARRRRASCGPAIDGTGYNLAEPPALDPRRNHRVDVLVDRLVLRPGVEKRLRASLEKALDLAQDVVLVSFEGGQERLLQPAPGLRALRRLGARADAPRVLLQQHATAPARPATGWACAGRWTPRSVMPDEEKTLLDGAIHPWQRHGPRLVREALEEVAARHGFSLEAPVRELPKKALQVLLQGDDDGFAGVVPYLKARVEALLRAGPETGEDGSPDTGGGRGLRGPLAPTSRRRSAPPARGRGCARRAWPCGWAAAPWPSTSGSRSARPGAVLAALAFGERERPVADRLLQEIVARLALPGVGGRRLPDASTAPPPRSPAARPTASAWPPRSARACRASSTCWTSRRWACTSATTSACWRRCRAIRDLGNTVVVVEHDEETIRAAD